MKNTKQIAVSFTKKRVEEITSEINDYLNEHPGYKVVSISHSSTINTGFTHFAIVVFEFEE